MPLWLCRRANSLVLAEDLTSKRQWVLAWVCPSCLSCCLWIELSSFHSSWKQVGFYLPCRQADWGDAWGGVAHQGRFAVAQLPEGVDVHMSASTQACDREWLELSGNCRSYAEASHVGGRLVSIWSFMIHIEAKWCKWWLQTCFKFDLIFFSSPEMFPGDNWHGSDASLLSLCNWASGVEDHEYLQTCSHDTGWGWQDLLAPPDHWCHFAWQHGQGDRQQSSFRRLGGLLFELSIHRFTLCQNMQRSVIIMFFVYIVCQMPICPFHKEQYWLRDIVIDFPFG